MLKLCWSKRRSKFAVVSDEQRDEDVMIEGGLLCAPEAFERIRSAVKRGPVTVRDLVESGMTVSLLPADPAVEARATLEQARVDGVIIGYDYYSPKAWVSQDGNIKHGIIVYCATDIPHLFDGNGLSYVEDRAVEYVEKLRAEQERRPAQ
jgi:hypothetical protein